MNCGTCHCRRVVKPSIMTRAVCGLNYEKKNNSVGSEATGLELFLHLNATHFKKKRWIIGNGISSGKQVLFYHFNMSTNVLELLTSKLELSHENESHHFSCQPSHMLNIFTTLICSLSLLAGNWSLFAFLWTSPSSQSTIIYEKNLPVFSHFDLMMLVNNIFITCFSQRSLWLGWTNMNCQGKKKCMMLRHRQKIFRKMVKTPCFKAYCKDWRKLFTHVWRNQDGMKVQLLGYLCSSLKVLTTVAQSQV